ncbi:NADH-quinone oxidoreductase subunit F [Candidatus Sumerlaeota bacterium]|nr:NADH-quinone oxidoreductase subunit F [Candidatus Sumerlaeota bacterium]
MVNPILLIIAPLSAAFIIPLMGYGLKRIVKFIPPLVMGFNLVVSLSLAPKVIKNPIIVFLGGFPPPFGINLYVGPLGILFSCVISLVGFIVSIYALNYIKQGAEQKYHALYLLLLTGATGIVLTGDIFNLFVFYEILCISSYALVGYTGEKAGIESASKYLIQGSLGSSLILIAIALLYGKFGTLNMADMASRIDSVHTMELFFPLVLFITGMGVESAIFPLNAWLPDAHSSAPSTISAILSGIAIKIGIYALCRVIFTIFGATDILQFLMLLGLVTLLVGEFSAFSQDNIKRMLAYSSTGQIGLIVFAMGVGTQYGISGGLFQFTTHALSKSLLFLTTGYMIYRAGSMKISALEGMGKKMPLTSVAFTIGAFSLIGLPPFIGFPSKFMIVYSVLARQSGLYIVFLALVLAGTVIEGAYFFKVIQAIYFKGERKDDRAKEAPLSALIPVIILVLLIIGIGIYPKVLTSILDSSAAELLDRIGYIKEALK